MNIVQTTDPLSHGLAQFRKDFLTVSAYFPTESLLHLKSNFARLIRGHYKMNGGGCIFHLLSEVLPKPIESRQDLIRYFTGKTASDCDDPEYLPAKHIVKIWDADLNHPHTKERYPGIKKIGRCFLMAVLSEAIALRMNGKAVPPRVARVARRNRMSAMDLADVF